MTLSYLNQQADDIPDYGIPWLFNQPAPVARNNYYGFRDGNYLRTKDNIATLRAEHDFSSHVSVRNQTRYARYLRDVQITEPQVLGTVTPATPLSAITDQPQSARLQQRRRLSGESDRRHHASSRPAPSNTQPSLAWNWTARIPTPPVPATPAFPPPACWRRTTRQKFAGVATINTIVHARSNSAAAYVIDTAKLGSHWELNGSFRFDRFNSHYTQAVASGRRVQPPGSPAFLARRRGLQARHAGQHLCVGRQFVQPVRRIPLAQRQHRQPSARRRIAPTNSAPSGTSRTPASLCAPPSSKPTSSTPASPIPPIPCSMSSPANSACRASRPK